MTYKKFETALDKYSNEIGSCVPLKESIDLVIPVNHLVERDVTTKLVQSINEGSKYETKHLATKEDLEEVGVECIGSDYFLFDKPTSFTIPVLVPQK